MQSIKVLATRWFAFFAALAVMLMMTVGGMMNPASAKPGGGGKPDKAHQSYVSKGHATSSSGTRPSHTSKGHAKSSAPHGSPAKSAPSKVHSTSTAKSGSGSPVRHPKPNTYQAQSDPDGMENGGVDQPGGQGGVNTSAQDGNNGSGNDIDCEDDNRGRGVPGHCKNKHKDKDKSEHNNGACQGAMGADRHGMTNGGHVSHGHGKGLDHSKHEDCPVNSTPGTASPDTQTPGSGDTTSTETPGTAGSAPDTAAGALEAATPGTVLPDAAAPDAATPGAVAPGADALGAVVPDLAAAAPVPGNAEVLGAQASAPKAGVAARAGTNAQVRGVSAEASKSSANPIKAAFAGVLPNTGGGKFLGLLLLAGLAAVAVGAFTLAKQRKTGRPTV